MRSAGRRRREEREGDSTGTRPSDIRSSRAFWATDDLLDLENGALTHQLLKRGCGGHLPEPAMRPESVRRGSAKGLRRGEGHERFPRPSMLPLRVLLVHHARAVRSTSGAVSTGTPMARALKPSWIRAQRASLAVAPRIRHRSDPPPIRCPLSAPSPSFRRASFQASSPQPPTAPFPSAEVSKTESGALTRIVAHHTALHKLSTRMLFVEELSVGVDASLLVSPVFTFFLAVVHVC